MGGKRRARGNRRRSSSSSSYSGNPFVIRSSGAGSSSQQNNQTGQNNQNTGRIRDTKVEQERNEGSYLDTVIPGTGNPAAGGPGETYRQRRNREAHEAFKASQARQEELKKAIDLAYNVKKDDGSGRSIIDQSTSNFQNLDFNQKQQLIDAGLAKLESSGVLGGTFGAELVSNQIKEEMQNATTQEELNAAFAKMDALTGSTEITDKMAEQGLLSFDPSAVFSFGDVESDDFLKNAFYNMQSSDLTPGQYTNYMSGIPAFGHQGIQSGFGSGGGGYGYGYGGGSGGGGGYGLNMGMGMQGQPRQRGQVGPGDLQERVNQAFLSGGQQSRARGGIISLVED